MNQTCIDAQRQTAIECEIYNRHFRMATNSLMEARKNGDFIKISRGYYLGVGLSADVIQFESEPSIEERRQSRQLFESIGFTKIVHDSIYIFENGKKKHKTLRTSQHADNLGITVSSLHNYANGTSFPKYRMGREILHYFGHKCPTLGGSK